MALLLLLLPVIIGLGVYAGANDIIVNGEGRRQHREGEKQARLSENNERRAREQELAQARLPEDQQIAAAVRGDGLNGLRPIMRRFNARFLPQRQSIANSEIVLAAKAAAYDKHYKPVLDAHPNLLPYVLAMTVLSAIGVFLFVAQQQLEIGLVKTLMPNDSDKALVLGSIIALISVLIGGVLMELLLPGKAFPQIAMLEKQQRIGWIAGAAAAFAILLGVLPNLAVTRSDTLYGDIAIQKHAACIALTNDVDASEADRTLACEAAEQIELKRDRTRMWDRTVAVAAPIGEAVGVWALLRLAELGAAFSAGALLEGRRRKLTVQRNRLDQDEANRDVLIDAGLVAADVTPEEFVAWHRRQNQAPDAPGADEDPVNDDDRRQAAPGATQEAPTDRRFRGIV